MLTFTEFCYQRAGVKPITDDILNRARFTNLHRELDRNTRFFLANCKSIDQWLVAVRYNNVNTFKACVFDNNNSLLVDESLNSLSQLKVLETRAYMVNSWYSGQKGNHLACSIDWLIKVIKPVVEPLLSKPLSIFELASELKSLPNIGTFFAYQWALGFSYFNQNIVFDNQVLLGPGARKGLKITGQTLGQLLCSRVASDLMLDAAALEHSLCEYYKYCHIAGSLEKKVRKKYKPSGKPLLPLQLPAHYITHYKKSFPQALPEYIIKFGF